MVVIQEDVVCSKNKKKKQKLVKPGGNVESVVFLGIL
jgi:hypothetical protein